MIALLDYGAGNLSSVEKALRYVGSDVELMQTPDRVKDADAVVLPGVGAFDDCITAMRRQELFNAAKEFANSGRPFLGICVCLLYTSPSPRDVEESRMPSSA